MRIIIIVYKNSKLILLKAWPMTLSDQNATLGQSSTLETSPDTGSNATTSMSIEESEPVSSSKFDFVSSILNS